MKKILMKGNEALAEGALLAGCHAFFGYHHPSSELWNTWRKMPKLGRTFAGRK